MTATMLDMTDDAARSAVAALRYLRNGQEGAAVLLLADMDGAELESFAGACLALASASLQVADALSEQVTLATGRLAATSEDILRLMMLGERAIPYLADYVDGDDSTTSRDDELWPEDEVWHD
jgi:hypothetical protein